MNKDKKRFFKKAYKLAKKVKKVLNCRWYKKKTNKQIALLTDILFMDEALIDFLILDYFKTEQQYINSINAFFDLEAKAFNYNEQLIYQAGRMHSLTQKVYLQHDYMEFKLKIGI
tara:strand:- start:8121 stop:8465 length:345 start_codon:yes stop_codon:yes gene_type:complete